MATAADFLSHPERAWEYVGVLQSFQPMPLTDDRESESRVVLCGISWDDHMIFDKALGDDRPGPRFNYLVAKLAGSPAGVSRGFGGGQMTQKYFHLYA